MKIVIAGGSGFIGSALTDLLVREGHELFILTRKLNKEPKQGVTYVRWLVPASSPENELQDIDVFINLAGESIAAKRWTSSQKEKILTSRIEATRSSIELIRKLNKMPSVFVNASAVGYYGSSETKTFTEQDSPAHENFLTKVSQVWEEEALAASDLGMRTVLVRIGIVLHEKEGALSQMLTPYKLFCGGTVGSGKQWLSWIHANDLIRLFHFSITNQEIKGPINATAPNPVQMKEFGQTIARVLNRPHWVPAPSFALQILLGEMSTLVLEGQKVLPQKALQHGFTFQYPSLGPALTNLLT